MENSSLICAKTDGSLQFGTNCLFTITGRQQRVEVRVLNWALCGSDLRGLKNGKVTPSSMGHELAGVLTEAPYKGRVVSVNPMVPCFECDRCLAGHHRLCCRRKTLGFELPGARHHSLLHDSRLIYLHKVGISSERACLTEHLAVAVHLSREVERRHPTINGEIFVIGDGPIGFSCALTLRKYFNSKITLFCKSSESVFYAEQYGFYTNNHSHTQHTLQIPSTVDLIVLACDLSQREIRFVPGSRPILVAEIARQEALNLSSERVIHRVDSFAYDPLDFSIAATLIDSDCFSFQHASTTPEPIIPEIANLAFSTLKRLRRPPLKHIFKLSS